MLRQILTGTRRGRVVVAALTACVLACVLAACGGSSSGIGSGSSNPESLLKQTFSGHHPVKSGTINLRLTLTPSGSSLLKQPITLSFGGPFQSQGVGKVPDSDFTIKGSADGHAAVLSVISAAGHGYVSAWGNSYEMPAGEYKRIESGFGSVGGSGSSSHSALSKLGIDPRALLSGPTVAGSATIGGVQTTRINSAINVRAVIKAVEKLLSDSSQLGIKDAAKLPALRPATVDKLVSVLGHPRFSVWTGSSDHILRKLSFNDHLTVSGSFAKELGGLSGLSVSLVFGHGQVNQPQTINAPTSLKPYSQFQTKVRGLLGTLELLTGRTVSQTGSVPGSSAIAGTDQKYSRCITKANGNATKMQACQALL